VDQRKRVERRCGSAAPRSANIAWARSRGIGRWIAVALSVAMPGACRVAEKAVDTAGSTTREWIARVEPTGAAQGVEAQTQAWRAIQAKVESLDVQALNETLNSLRAATDRLGEQLKSVSPRSLSTIEGELVLSAGALRHHLESPELKGMLASLERASQAIEQQASAMELKRVPALIENLTRVTVELGEAIARLDESARQVLVEVGTLTRQTTATVDSLPVASLQRSTAILERSLETAHDNVAALPAVRAQLEDVLRRARTALRLTTVVVSIFGLCGLGWLIGALRKSIVTSSGR